MKNKIEAILQKTMDGFKENTKKQAEKNKVLPAAKLSTGKLVDTGKKVNLVELTGGEKKLTHDQFCKIVYKSTFIFKKGDNRCRVGVVKGSDIKIFVLTGDEMDTVYDSVVKSEKEHK